MQGLRLTRAVVRLRSRLRRWTRAMDTVVILVMLLALDLGLMLVMELETELEMGLLVLSVMRGPMPTLGTHLGCAHVLAARRWIATYGLPLCACSAGVMRTCVFV